MVNGSPINLESNIPIMADFKDDGFGFNYENIDPKTSYKFNQTIESLFVKIDTSQRWRLFFFKSLK